MKRLLMIGDALSQLANVTFLPNIDATNANESISGRAYRQGWKKTEKAINWLFSLVELDHCKKSHEADVARAKSLINS